MTDLEPIAPRLASLPLLELVARENWASPKRVTVSPEAHSQIDQCYVNVLGRIDRFGGTGAYCWKMLEFPKLFLQAIHHAVWIDRDGKMVDVTPDIRRWRKMVVVPDHVQTFSGLPAGTVSPKFLNISGLPEVDELVDISCRLTTMRIAMAHPSGLLPQLDDQDPIVIELLNKARLLYSVANSKVA